MRFENTDEISYTKYKAHHGVEKAKIYDDLSTPGRFMQNSFSQMKNESGGDI